MLFLVLRKSAFSLRFASVAPTHLCWCVPC
uniref:Uncharacterized protein n=1 Tax=Anopheles funestus TaxID=62324 RepID=A0A4Y0BGV1_ANOFN